MIPTVDVHPLDTNLTQQPLDAPPDATLAFRYQDGRLFALDTCQPDLDSEHAFQPDMIRSFSELADVLQDSFLDFYWANFKLRTRFLAAKRHGIPEAALVFVQAYPELFGLRPGAASL